MIDVAFSRNSCSFAACLLLTLSCGSGSSSSHSNKPSADHSATTGNSCTLKETDGKTDMCYMVDNPPPIYNLQVVCEKGSYGTFSSAGCDPSLYARICETTVTSTSRSGTYDVTYKYFYKSTSDSKCLGKETPLPVTEQEKTPVSQDAVLGPKNAEVSKGGNCSLASLENLPVKLITTAAELKKIESADASYHYKLANDISVSSNWSPGSASNMIFDGNGFKIKNLAVDPNAGQISAGLFSFIKCSRVRNLTISGAVVKPSSFENYNSGVLAGRLFDVELDGITIEDFDVSGRNAGGIAGSFEATTPGVDYKMTHLTVLRGTVRNFASDSDWMKDPKQNFMSAGGFFGKAYGTSYSQLTASAVSVYGDEAAGGFAGRASNFAITAANLAINVYSEDAAGGIAGKISGASFSAEGSLSGLITARLSRGLIGGSCEIDSSMSFDASSLKVPANTLKMLDVTPGLGKNGFICGEARNATQKSFTFAVKSFDRDNGVVSRIIGGFSGGGPVLLTVGGVDYSE